MLRANRASIDSGILGWIFPSLRDSSGWGLKGLKKLPIPPPTVGGMGRIVEHKSPHDLAPPRFGDEAGGAWAAPRGGVTA